jgi:uncharacterized protein YkwD
MIVFFFVRAFVRVDGAADRGMTEAERAGVERVNRLRMILGVLPLEGDARLARAIDLHLQDMEKHGYFGHAGKSEEGRTPQQRCRLQGYEAPTGENLAGSPESAKSIEMWRWDGGHFRNMIHPSMVQIGYGIGASASGFNVGSGDGTRLPRPSLPWK